MKSRWAKEEEILEMNNNGQYILLSKTWKMLNLYLVSAGYLIQNLVVKITKFVEIR